MKESTKLSKSIKWYLIEYFLGQDSLHNNADWKMKAGKFMNRYGNGNGLINFLKDFVTIIGIGGILIGIRINLPFYIFIILGFGWVIGCYTLGFWNEFFGFWGKQNEHSTKSKEIQPVMNEIYENIKQIKKLISNKKV